MGWEAIQSSSTAFLSGLNVDATKKLWVDRIVGRNDMSSLSSYREFSPGPSLEGLVECFWSSTVTSASNASRFHRVLPDGCIDLLFDFTAVRDRRATVVGTMSRPLTFTTTGQVDLLGVRFRPGGLSAISNLNAAGISDD